MHAEVVGIKVCVSYIGVEETWSEVWECEKNRANTKPAGVSSKNGPFKGQQWGM